MGRSAKGQEIYERVKSQERLAIEITEAFAVAIDEDRRSPRELRAALGWKPGTMTKFMRGSRRHLTVDHIADLARVLGLEPTIQLTAPAEIRRRRLVARAMETD